MATRSTLEGVATLTKQLIELGSLDNGNVLRGAVRAGMGPAFDRYIQMIPIGTEAHRTYRGLLVAPGFAKEHVKRATTVNGAKNVASCVLGVSKEAYYILQYVEVGTRYQKPQPNLRAAFSETRDAGEEKLRAYLQKAVIKAAGK